MNTRTTDYRNYLALGDSYTIGEGVPLHDSFPYQLVQLLRSRGNDFSAAEIIARTGWTSGQLMDQLNSTRLSSTYDLVTLLIGVNNQYRGLPLVVFRKEAAELATTAIRAAGERAGSVRWLSIPDWGLTPFAKERSQRQIATEIDEYNFLCRSLAESAGIPFIDITGDTREHPDWLAADGLHYSAEMNGRWAEKIALTIE